LFGVYFGLLFKRNLPFVFIVITGYLWGALIWVVGGTLIQILKIPYTAASMASLFVFLVLGISVVHVRNKTWKLSRQESIYLLPFTLCFILVMVLASHYNYSIASPDSAVMIATGRRFAFEGFSSAIIEELSLRGVFLPQLQSASVFLGDDYLFAAQPAFGYTFVLAYFYLSQRILGQLGLSKRQALVFTLLATLTLFTTYFIAFQFFYIHTNLISAAYLFVSISGFWLASVEGNEDWMNVGVLALLGFSLARTEAPLFALLFLILVISAGRVSFRIRFKTILPYLSSLIFWYLYLYWRMGEGTYILNPERTLLVIGSLVALALLVLLSEVKVIMRYLLPHLPRIMLGVLVLLLIFMVIQKPDHFRISIYASIFNILETGEWGLTWLVFTFLFFVSLTGPRVPGEELFFYGILAFFAILLAIVYFRVPYHASWGDSANRMFTHILPIVVLYVLMKATQGLSQSETVMEKTNKKRNQ
jgi:hypothetical protein